MPVFRLPFDLPAGSSVLVAGAGGGFDFLCGLPIAMTLLDAGHTVHLANYSFTDLASVSGAAWTDGLYMTVDHQSSITGQDYFPELHCSAWFHERKGLRMPVHCFPRIGVRPLSRAYATLGKRLALDAVFVVDGGVDGIFRGDEHDLGTPSMDSASIIAGSISGIKRRFYAMTAFGSEGVAKEVAHAEVLARIADLARQDAYLGVSALVRGMSAGSAFLDAHRFINSRLSGQHHGNIPGSIAAALEGAFGDTAFNLKTRQNPIWVSALTGITWFFELDAVAKLKRFHDEVTDTDDIEDIATVIERYRPMHKPPRPSIPI